LLLDVVPAYSVSSRVPARATFSFLHIPGGWIQPRHPEAPRQLIVAAGAV